MRLDEPLARELRRIAGARGTSESDVARGLLRYGIEVSRRLEAQSLAEPWRWERRMPDDAADVWPMIADIDACWRRMTVEELREHGYGEWFDEFHGEHEENSDAP